MTLTAPTARAGSAPDEWLDRIITHLTETGRAEVSLRQLATVAGTSHRMLFYYFGSRDGVLVSVLDALRRREASDLMLGATGRRAAMQRTWQYFSDPRREIEMKLLFHLCGRAVQEPDVHQMFGNGGIEVWVTALTELGASEGLDPAEAALDARLLVAAARGLALDRLLSGDAAGVDAAFDRLLDRVLRG